MKYKKLILVAALAATVTITNVYADSFDNSGPSSDVVSGSGAMNYNGVENGSVQGSGAMNYNGNDNGPVQGDDAMSDGGPNAMPAQGADTIPGQNMGIVPPADTNQSGSAISRDGETMGDEDY